MFEKEAEDKAFEKYPLPPGCGEKDIERNITYEEGFKDGAEFAYNKANEWHYPSKGEYPKECENVWCYCKGLDVKFCCVGHTIVGGDNRVRWVAMNIGRLEESQVIAWKEIVLPELKESK